MKTATFENISLDKFFNAEMTEIFNQRFMSPHPEGYSIGARINGRYAWEWNRFGHNELVLFVFGTTNVMQSYVENARVAATCQDDSESICKLVEPVNFDDFSVTAIRQQFETFYRANGNHRTSVRLKFDSLRS